MSLAATITINKRHGLHATFIFLMCACMKKLMYFKVLKGMTLTLDTVDKRCLEPHPKYPGEVVAGNAIRALISRESGVSGKFVAHAVERGDWAIEYSALASRCEFSARAS